MDARARIRDGTGLRGFRLSIYLTIVCVIGGAVAWFQWRQNRVFFEPATLLSRFPVEDAAVFHIDFAMLRRSGLPGGSKIAPEPEYKQFLDGTGFDYRRDLDLLVASLSKSGNFFIARGRFDWNKLNAYALHQGGSCYHQLCRMQGSTPERHISFLPLRNDTLALAVSTDDLAASRMAATGPRVTASLPGAPVWLSVPGAALRKKDALSPGLHLMLSALASSDRVVVTVEPGAHGMEARMEATCRTQDDARVLASQLRNVTGLLKDAMTQDIRARDDELARMLAAGSFDQTDRLVAGKWPVGRNLIESLTAGI